MRAGGVDILLLDLNLPDSRGVDTLVRVREVTALPIIVVTGVEDKQTAAQVLGSGAQDHLIKGNFNAELLGRAMHRCLPSQIL